jgi:hypothetical protein
LEKRSRRVCQICVTRVRIWVSFSANSSGESASLAPAIGLLAQLDLVARGEQLRDGALGVEDALALHFGRVRGEHGRHVAVGQRGDDVVGLDTPALRMRASAVCRSPSALSPARSASVRRRIRCRSSARLARWLK